MDSIKESGIDNKAYEVNTAQNQKWITKIIKFTECKISTLMVSPTITYTACYAILNIFLAWSMANYTGIFIVTNSLKNRFGSARHPTFNRIGHINISRW